MIYDLAWMRRRHAEGPWEGLFFWGHRQKHDGTPDKSCCSQWFPAGFDVDGVHYPTAEHWMMASKARLFGDDNALAAILACPDAPTVKKLGRTVAGFEPGAWADHCAALVQEGNTHKFRQNPALGRWLANTGSRILVEAAPNDRVWGIGLGASDPRVHDPATWQGTNLLGFALMAVRDTLLQE